MRQPGKPISKCCAEFLIMENKENIQVWEEYREQELARTSPILQELGFILDQEQAHIGGERFLMVGERDVGGGGYKLVLTGTRASDGKRVIIKVSSDAKGKKEIRTERQARETLHALKFAYFTILSPQEILFTERKGITIFITAYIEQEKTFLERPIEEQFSLALVALKTQEGMHAATPSHINFIRDTFGIWDADTYLKSFGKFETQAILFHSANPALVETFKKAKSYLQQHRETIEQYCGFLTHADFVPHNLRIEGNTIYLLDYASLHFGNKHESWARFLNFMLLYNRPLEAALLQYVRENRTPEEYFSIRLMRIYKLGFLLSFYAESLDKTSGNLRTLSEKRLDFWRTALESLLTDTPLSQEVIETYKNERDALRSEEEKERQKNLH
jgi:hypothetical protein